MIILNGFKSFENFEIIFHIISLRFIAIILYSLSMHITSVDVDSPLKLAYVDLFSEHGFSTRLNFRVSLGRLLNKCTVFLFIFECCKFVPQL